jgi:uncharacterized protein RhaS with RHS repeats
VNTYTYVLNDPVNKVDPMGLADSYVGGIVGLDPIFPRATKAAEVVFPENADKNGKRDAMRHCLASCMATLRYGSTIAEGLGVAHESRRESGAISDPKNTSRSCQMDLHNNFIGASEGESANSNADCVKRCAIAVENQVTINNPNWADRFIPSL